MSGISPFVADIPSSATRLNTLPTAQTDIDTATSVSPTEMETTWDR